MAQNSILYENSNFNNNSQILPQNSHFSKISSISNNSQILPQNSNNSHINNNKNNIPLNSRQPFLRSKSQSCYALTPEEMFKIEKKKEGYVCPRIYFDARESIWLRRRGEILKMRNVPWPPADWPTDREGKKIMPKKRNFIDDQLLWASSFTDRRKQGEVEEEKKEEKKAKLNLRSLFLASEKQKRERKAPTAPWKEEARMKVIEKIKSSSPPKDIYSSFSSKRGFRWGKEERVMYNMENMFIGENIPFWNGKGEGEKEEFNPSIKLTTKKAPAYSFGPFKRKDNKEEKKERKDNHEKSKGGEEKVSESFWKVQEHGKLYYIFRKEKRVNPLRPPSSSSSSTKQKEESKLNYKKIYTYNLRKSVY